MGGGVGAPGPRRRGTMDGGWEASATAVTVVASGAPGE